MLRTGVHQKDVPRNTRVCSDPTTTKCALAGSGFCWRTHTIQASSGTRETAPTHTRVTPKPNPDSDHARHKVFHVLVCVGIRAAQARHKPKTTKVGSKSQTPNTNLVCFTRLILGMVGVGVLVFLAFLVGHPACGRSGRCRP